MNDKNIFKERIEKLPQIDGKSEPYILKQRIKHARSHMEWDNNEDALLLDLAKAGVSVPYLSKQLKRSTGAITSRLKRLNEERKTEESEKEVALSESNFFQNSQATEVIRYWRNSLSDMDKMGLSTSKMKQAVQLPSQLFKEARLPSNKIQSFFDEAEEALRKTIKKKLHRKKLTDQEEPAVHQLPVIIAPYIAVKCYEHGQKMGGSNDSQKVYPLWFVATLKRDGTLDVPEELSYPWIERRCLTPNESQAEAVSYPILGDVSEVDAFYAENVFTLEEEKKTGLKWGTFFGFAENLFQSLLDRERDLLFNQHYQLLDVGAILPAGDVLQASHHILSTYDQYLLSKNKKIPSLLEKFCSLEQVELCEALSPETIFDLSKQHLGQMQDHYPLSASQRLSLSYLNAPEHDEIFTIHGPPGTGKTSFLLSVIVSKWIQAIIDQKMPPLLVVASTNNLAVTNVLDNLNQSAQRWLPRFNSYGLYLASKQRAKEAEEKQYPYRLKGNFCSIESMYSAEYCAEATAHVIQQFNQYFEERSDDLSTCKNYIYQKILHIKSLLDKIINFTPTAFSLQQSFFERHGTLEEIEEKIQQNDKKKQHSIIKLHHFHTLKKEWWSYKTKELKWLRFFSWFPFVNVLLKEKITLFMCTHPELNEHTSASLDEIDQIIIKKTIQYQEQQKKTQKIIEDLQQEKIAYENVVKEQKKLEKLSGTVLSINDWLDFSSEHNVLSKLDTTLRYTLFNLATHYWEIEWLLNNQTLSTLSYNREDRKFYWQIQSMLTPCFVTTLHSGPGFFQYRAASQEFEVLDNFVDLLIIDEAGQVMPAIAGALVSTAKKILLVGDTKQIEPIFSLTEGIDFANTKKFGLCTDEYDYEQLKQAGILCSGDTNGHAYGNLVVVGQQKSKFHQKDQQYRGLLLKEHRRCAKEIISYCNELCYANQLIPMTVEKPSLFPRMGYAHIKGVEEKRGGSRFNRHEAETIAAWIHKNQEKILTMCQEKLLDDCIGIVTPFAAQSNALRNALYERGIKLSKAGTIHSLQGAEKPIIIFSPVYSAANTETFFFDRTPNMLNVAVSRAKMSFLVFGDMDVFDPLKTHLPSSLLAKYLFAAEENEIVDLIQPGTIKNAEPEEIDTIVTLDKHRRSLARAFHSAKQEICIVSPFIRENAIKSDNILAIIHEHHQRISIKIYTDPELNKHHQKEFNTMVDALRKAGAQIMLVNKVHSKIITIDERIIVQGSFNWLSASRDLKFSREESSLIYQGKKVSQVIDETMTPIQKKVFKNT
jgi:hypothetical protein